MPRAEEALGNDATIGTELAEPKRHERTGWWVCKVGTNEAWRRASRRLMVRTEEREVVPSWVPKNMGKKRPLVSKVKSVVCWSLGTRDDVWFFSTEEQFLSLFLLFVKSIVTRVIYLHVVGYLMLYKNYTS